MLEFICSLIKIGLKHLDLIIPTGLTIYGWYLVYTEGNRLAKRNETLSLYLITRKILEDVGKESEAIWLSTQRDLSELDEAKISAYLAELELCLIKMQEYYCKITVTNIDLAKLRRALTSAPYPINGQAATSEKRIKVIKTLVSEMSLDMMKTTYEHIHKKK